MAEKKGCQDCPDTRRDMSRGEFLKTSAVAAGGVAVGGGVEAAEAAPIRPPRPPDNCPGAIRWAIPAGVLNVFWADIYPRLVARQWVAQESNTQDVIWEGMSRQDLANAVSTWISSGGPQSEFERRCEMFVDYLGWGRSAPISVAGADAYDFLLSSGDPNQSGNPNHPDFDPGGVELFIPTIPESPTELFRYYSFRRTGRPALGVPYYLDGRYSAVTIDSPTGPNRLSVSGANLSQQDVQCLGAVWTREERWDLGGIEGYKCLKKRTRCWQLEGAVYRGIATEVPRIVAIMWQEEAQNIASRYRIGFQNVNENPNQVTLREIVEERLELTLPASAEMFFQKITGNEPIFTHNGQAPELASDIIITNRGFHFPNPPNLAPKTLRDLCQLMANGLAGNPVFTSSERTLQT